jgi:hypothetical protein
VISNLGGNRSEVQCPWCEGSGIQPSREHDAQANAPEAPPSKPETPPSTPEAPASTPEATA